MVTIYQTYYDDAQLRRITNGCIPVDTRPISSGQDREFPIFEYVSNSHKSNDYWGVLSWKFEAKCQIELEHFVKYAKNKFNEGYDCVFINPFIATEALYMNPWEQGAMNHGNLGTILIKLDPKIPSIGFSKIQTVEKFAFCNYFVGNRKFWERYIAYVNGVIGAVEEMGAKDDELRHLWRASANYPRDLSLTIKPFFIERLFGSFLDSHDDIKFNSYQYDLEQYIQRFGNLIGKKIYELSWIKRNSSFNAWDQHRGVLFASNFVYALNIEDQSDLILNELRGE